ncbi:MAG: restriction endonuclease [Dehalococcoidia bacterium]|nr:restriction endonuclease [Dehalococcoidia bacterium]
MAQADKRVEPARNPEVAGTLLDDPMARKLVAEMLAGRIANVRPQYDFTTELGYTYPVVEQAANLKGKDALAIMESLAARDIVAKSFFDRLIRCPRCQGVNLRPSSHCPKCGSGHVMRGRILEHFACKYIGIEEEFTAKGKYVCPRCRMELRTIGTDYRSQGVLYKCHDCSEVFNVPFIKWRCLKCSSLVTEDEVGEIVIYSYSFDESKRNWLEFELQPKLRFVEFLKQHGYKVAENARVRGRSGAEHSLDILATRDDGVITHTLAIGIEIARERIGLDRILDFDVKAYDSGIHDKILIVIPELGEEARKFASYQRIKVLEPRDLEILLTGRAQPARETVREPFEFESKSQLMQYLEKQGYTVKEKTEVKGRSGAVHNMDILATKDEGIITHRIAVGIERDEKPMGLERVFDFDDKAYDAGILDKVFIAVPGLTKEAMQFAKRQGIRVLAVSRL